MLAGARAAHGAALSGLAVGLAMLGVAPAFAAELYADGLLRQQFEYDTNVTLRDDGDDAFGSRTIAGLLLGARTPATELALDSRVRLVRFTGDRNLDSEDVLVDGNGRWQWPRSVLELEAGVVSDTTRELLDEESGEFIDENVDRLTVDVGSSLSHRVTQLDTATVGVSYRRRWFPSVGDERADLLDLEEFSYYSTSGSWSRRLAPALTAQTVLAGSWFDSESRDTVAIQTQVGADYVVSPAMSLGGTAGPTIVYTDRDEPGVDSETTLGALWDINAFYQVRENTALAATFFQGLNPQSSGGALNFRTGLEIEADYEITPKTSFQLPALVQRQDPIGDEVGDASDTRYFARIQPTLSHRLTPNLALETSYRFRWQTFDDDERNEGGLSHAIFVSFAYELPRLLSSR